MVPHLELQMWQGAALSGGHNKHLAVPTAAPQGTTGATAKCETVDVTFPAAGLMGRAPNITCGGEVLHQGVQKNLFSFISLSLLTPQIQMLLLMLLREVNIADRNR